jgi:UDP-N-acetyl-D-mannosaminuronate dehydrogenase
VGLGADVRAADPHVDDRYTPVGVNRVEATADEARQADAVIVVVDHDDFDLDALVTAAPYVFDTKHCVEGPNVEHL